MSKSNILKEDMLHQVRRQQEENLLKDEKTGQHLFQPKINDK